MAFLLDAHTHTSNYSWCSTVTPEQLLDRAVECDLDGVVLTEHGQFWPEDELEQLRRRYPTLRIFNGAELEVERLHHVLLYLPEPVSVRTLPDQPERFVEAVAEHGGFAAAAHPYRYFGRYHERTEGIQLDGVEIASGNMCSSDEIEQSRLLAEAWEAVMMASSDAHGTEPVGKYLTRLEREPETMADLIEELHDGRVEPVIEPSLTQDRGIV